MTATLTPINIAENTAKWMRVSTSVLNSERIELSEVNLEDTNIAHTAIDIARIIYQEEDQTNRNNAAAFRTHLASLQRQIEHSKEELVLDPTLFRDLPYSKKTEVIILLLSAVIAVNEQYPARKINTSGPDDGVAVTNWLENIWRARQKWDVPFNQDHELKTALDWENTSGAIGMSMNESLLIFGGTFALDNEDHINKACNNLHKIMTRYKLWGSNTETYNIPYEELPQDMKDNYVLMIMVGLAALSENAKQDRSSCDNGGD